ncbi:MAG: hypothetical protein DRJ35_06260 [Thermoprotei archaeon]|nr:MAG: hypothetical protein DRJ35_06260 [Thermoprotei archaeon]
MGEKGGEEEEERKYYSSPFARLHYEEWKKAQQVYVYDKISGNNPNLLKISLILSLGGVLVYIILMFFILGQ